jgi:large subunit ribosomal protein L3
MPKRTNPRKGSLQYWPRVRAKRETPRIRDWAPSSEAKLIGFAGYKAGMTHVTFIDNQKTSMMKGQEVVSPVTIIECPPIKVAAVRFYKKTENGVSVLTEIFSDKLDKDLAKTIILPKKVKKTFNDVKDFAYIRLLVYTQPKLTAIGKKKPEMFELAVGGKKEDQLKYAKEKLGNEITLNEVFKEGLLLDVHSVSKGKGFQGPVKRFGIKIRQHKAEKTKRGPGTLGAWSGQAHLMWRVPYAGKMGYHLRTEYNKRLLKISSKPEEINPNGGFINYGFVKSSYMMIRGGIAGSKKRLITFSIAKRPTKNMPLEAPSIQYISTESKQKR